MVFVKKSGGVKNIAQDQVQKKKPFQISTKNIEESDDDDNEDLSDDDDDDDDVDLDSDENDNMDNDDDDNDGDSDEDDDEDDMDEEEVTHKNSKMNLSAKNKQPNAAKQTPQKLVQQQTVNAKSILKKTPLQKKPFVPAMARKAQGDASDEEDDDEDDEDDDFDEELTTNTSKNSKINLISANKQNPKQPAVNQKQQQQKTPQKGSQNPTLIKNASAQDKSNSKAEVKLQQKRKATDLNMPEPKRKKLEHLTAEQIEIEARREKERNTRSLFIGKVPPNATDEDFHALSKDIVEVRSPYRKGKKGLVTRRYAFVEFLTEVKAEENYVKLQNKKLGGQKIAVDFVGEKSSKEQKNRADYLKKKTINKQKLFVSGLPPECDLSEVTNLFPTAESVALEPNKRFAYVLFKTDAAADTVFKKSENVKLHGRTLTVLFAVEGRPKKNKKKGKAAKKQTQQQKTPMVKKDDSEEDDEGDDDEGDDDEEDDSDDAD